MNQTAPKLEHLHLLLDLLGPARFVAQEKIDALTPDAWTALLARARQHRVLPLLGWQLRHTRTDLRVPEVVLDQLNAVDKRSRLRTLAIQRELITVSRLLKGANIQHVALKGAYLAFHCYPRPGLRPMRDIDILVRNEDQFRAFDILLQAGFARIPEHPGSLEATNSIAKHLPPIVSNATQVCVEIHNRIFHAANEQVRIDDPTEAPAFWTSLVTAAVGSDELLFTAPEALLLHLIVHAAYDHEFDNGPLLLSDLAYLIERHTIDWPCFWQRATDAGIERGAALSLRLMETYWGGGRVDWSSAQSIVLDSDVLNEVVPLILCDMERQGSLKLQNIFDQKVSVGGKLGVVWRKLFPAKMVLCKKYPVSPSSPFVYWWYLVRWCEISVKNIPQFLASLQRPEFKRHSASMRRLRAWLFP